MSLREGILQAIAGGESETLEWKSSTGRRTDGAKAVCAFLNTRGGWVVYGVDPSGSIIGQTVGKDTLEDIAEEIGEIEPPVFPSIEHVEVEGKFLIVVTTERGAQQPYTYKGKAYKRVGRVTGEMSREEYNRILMERLHGQQRWELEVAEDWLVNDLDRTEITRTLEEAIRRNRAEDPGTRDPMDILRGFGLTKDGELLRAAVALFARSERLLPDYPQCLLKLAKFRGTDRTEFDDNRQFHGNAFDLLLRAERFLRDHLPIAGRIVPNLFERVDDPLYPPAALRETLANAICHRDYAMSGSSVSVGVYADRLEIVSGGPLPFGITPEQLYVPHESRLWNPLIAHVFYLRGIIEKWGRGTLKMMELTEKAGYARPVIEERQHHVAVIFRPSRYVPPFRAQRSLNEREQKILQYLAEEGPKTIGEIHSTLHLTEDKKELRKLLVVLEHTGVLRHKVKGRGSTWFLPDLAK